MEFLIDTTSNMIEKIKTALLLKYKNMGFSQKAIEAVAGMLEKTVTDESAIDGAVDNIQGLLSGFQSEIDARVSTAVAKAKAEKTEPPKEDPKPSDPPKPAEEVPAWAKAIIDGNKALSDKIAAIEQGKSTDTRKAQLEAALKDVTETYRNTKLNDFGYMSFDSDEKFTEYLTKVQTDSAAFLQVEANNGLNALGRPMQPAGPTSKTASKEEIAAVVDSL